MRANMSYWAWHIYRWVPRRCRVRWHGEWCKAWVWREPHWRKGACEECMPF